MKKWLPVTVLMVVAFAWGFAKYRAAQRELEKGPELVHLFAMSDYFPETFLKNYENKTNCKVTYDNFSSNEELLAKLQAGATGYDVIVPSDYMVRALVGSKLLTELDKSKIPNLKNISNQFRRLPYDPEDKYSVPYTWGTTGVIYNTKFVKRPISSWEELFAREFVGKISLLDDEREVLGAMLRKHGFSINTTEKKQLEIAQKDLIKLKPSVRVFASDPKQHVLSGDVWIAQIYSGDAAQLIKSNPELKYAVPNEGGTLWIDTMAIPASASSFRCAYAFVNEVLDPSNAKVITEQLGYSSPNEMLEATLADERLKPSYLRKLDLQKLEFLKDLGVDGQQWTQLWTEAKLH